MPLPATPVANLTSTLVTAWTAFGQFAEDAQSKLAIIARDYIDGRRAEQQRVARPDCRKSLEVLSAVAARSCRALVDLPSTHRAFLDEGLRGETPPAAWPRLPSEIGTSLLELAEYDLSIWLPNTPAQLRPALSRVRSLLQELGSRCAALPMQAEWALIEFEQNGAVDGATERSRSLYTLLDTLRTNASMAASSMKSARGPRSDTVRMKAVLRLKEEFARCGLAATHNPNDTTGYVGIGSSQFDQFVQAFFTAVEPDDTQRRGLNDAVSFACRRDSINGTTA